MFEYVTWVITGSTIAIVVAVFAKLGYKAIRLIADKEVLESLR